MESLSSQERRGSEVSDRQIYSAVKNGHPVRVLLGHGERIPLAYVMGLDDYHVALIDHEQSVHLVHKTVPCITILSDTTMDRDLHPDIDAIRQKTAGFREKVLKDHFNQQPAKEPLE